MRVDQNSTLDSLVMELRAGREALRQARIAGAKTQMEQLFAAGVICTEDDAMEAAMRYQRICEMAAEQGISHAEAEEQFYLRRDRVTVMYMLAGWYRQGETDDQRRLRAMEMVDAAEPRVAPGKVRVCKHRGTKHVAGLNIQGRYVWCNQCGYHGEIEDLTTKTPEAREAQRVILEHRDLARELRMDDILLG